MEEHALSWTGVLHRQPPSLFTKAVPLGGNAHCLTIGHSGLEGGHGGAAALASCLQYNPFVFRDLLHSGHVIYYCVHLKTIGGSTQSFYHNQKAAARDDGLC